MRLRIGQQLRSSERNNAIKPAAQRPQIKVILVLCKAVNSKEDVRDSQRDTVRVNDEVANERSLPSLMPF